MNPMQKQRQMLMQALGLTVAAYTLVASVMKQAAQKQAA